MRKILIAAVTCALIPVSAQAQLLGGGGLGGGLGGSLGGTLGGTLGGGTLGGGLERPVGDTLERTTRTVRGSAEAKGSTSGTQSVDARRGTVSAQRSADGSVLASTTSLADIVAPPAGAMTEAQGSGAASGQGSASAQLIGTDAVTGTVAPIVQGTRARAGEAVSSVRGAARPAGATATGSGAGSANGSLLAGPLAVAGSAAAAGQGAAMVSRGMPVTLPDGSSLGKVKELVANGRGEVEQVVVKQGNVTRALPAGMFSASGDALVLTQASGTAAAPEASEPSE
ncbi:hypothetical protein [Blastomonas sp. UPD001]|uniref:hypothetical protein n=1 Tax=Blastomonas sp. UPD001 TaxID=2217673 RepID=UPI000E35720F|nr:hypothetical protein [Blastomonas sp. UPD001]MBL0966688.1 hypothetical protein [Blastomonas sp.]